MNSDLYFDGKKYISSSRAAKISGYVNDYIGQLCRDGKLECRMIGRSWYVSFDSLIAHKNSNGSASKSKAQKIQKIEPVIDEKKEEASTLNFEPQEIPTQLTAPAQPDVVSKEVEVVKDVAPIAPDVAPHLEVSISTQSSVASQSHAPVEDFPLFAFDLKTPTTTAEVQKNSVVNAKDSAPLDQTVVHRIPVAAVQKENAKHEVVVPKIATPLVSSVYVFSNAPVSHHEVFGKTFPKVASMSLAALISFIGFQFTLSQNSEQAEIYARAARATTAMISEIVNPVTDMGSAVTASAVGGTQFFINELSFQVYAIVQSWTSGATRVIVALTGTRGSPKKEYTSDPPTFVSGGPSEGLVVVPVTAKTDKEATIAKIKKTFSDEVSVEVSGTADGVIRPVFRQTTGDDYLYVLVPVNN